MNKAVFLDRDGTINIDYGYIYKYEDFHYEKGAVRALRMLQDAGFLLVIITNQSGIARGYYTEEDFLALDRRIRADLREQGVEIAATYYCPHLGDGCSCRKPATGLFHRAAADLQIDYSKSYAIGDKMRDLSICKEQPVTGYLIGGKESKDGIKPAASLLDAAEQICSGISGAESCCKG